MPLSDGAGLDLTIDDFEGVGLSERGRFALPVPILHGAQQTNISQQPAFGTWLTSRAESHLEDRAQKLSAVTSPCKPKLHSTTFRLSEGQIVGTSPSQGLTIHAPRGDLSRRVPALEHQDSADSRPWPPSTRDLRGLTHLTYLLRSRQGAFDVEVGSASDVPRKPSHSNRKCRSENGVAVIDKLAFKDVPPEAKSATKLQNLFERVDEVQLPQSDQSRHMRPPLTAIAAPVLPGAGVMDAADLHTTLLSDGTSSGSLNRPNKPNSAATMGASSVDHDPSPAHPGSPSLPRHHPSHPSGRPSHRPKTSCPALDRKSPHCSTQSPQLKATLSSLCNVHRSNMGKRLDRGQNEIHLDTLSLELDDFESLPVSPRSVSSNGSTDGTPMTSPSRSPLKSRLELCHFSAFAKSIVQLDGETGGLTDKEEEFVHSETSRRTEQLREEAVPCTSEHTTESSNDIFYSTCSNQPADDESTPLVTPSLAEGAYAFPFPRASITPFQSRHPSTLLQHFQRNATPRQRRLMTGGTRTPDRFIPSRAETPTKQSMHLAKLRSKPTCYVANAPESDPFGPVPSRSLRLADQYATLRSPTRPLLPTDTATRVEVDQTPSVRAASVGTIWTVGGTMVTEGIASVTNSRGGRVTSGTNAPHYAAEFLHKNSPSEDEVTHSRRLAIAMDIDRAARMLVHSSAPSSLSSPESGGSLSPNKRSWKDGVWQREDCVTPTKGKPKKVKDVPVIPFRVLDAPALRDDYYCSLLSYSPTIQCLAIGLGPHVYLWSEKRGSTSLPDSLTAPAGSSHVTSVSFSSVEGESAILALGRADGRVTLWSPLDPDPRFDSNQPSPISCLCFRPNTVLRTSLRDSNVMVATEELLIGDEVGFVYFYSVEWPDKDQRDLFDWHGSMTLVARIECHSQQVCGLAWSADGDYFATGGNDNQLFLFDTKNMLQRPAAGSEARSTVRVRARGSRSSNATVTGQGEVLAITPGAERHIFTLNAAVKAIAFAPWQSTLLAAGGGSNDRCIHFFHTLSRSPLATIDCHAQVTSLVWSEKRKEIASTFGFAQPEHPYRVAVFAWPSCNMVVRIPWWSEERALFAVAYPRGPTTGQHGQGASSTVAQHIDAEGRPWYGKRTREEGCLVVATSDASIKFHEIWAEKTNGGSKRVSSGVFGGSQIFEEEYTGDVERWGRVIR